MWNSPSTSPAERADARPLRLGAGNPELQALVDAAYRGGPGLILMHLDIDHFASVN